MNEHIINRIVYLIFLTSGICSNLEKKTVFKENSNGYSQQRTNISLIYSIHSFTAHNNRQESIHVYKLTFEDQ